MQMKVSVRIGTVLMNARLSLVEILNIMFRFSEEKLVLDTSAITINKNTVSKWFKILRLALEKSLEEVDRKQNRAD
jgi:hypothetical protein